MRGFGLTGAARFVRLLVSDDLPDLVLGSRCVGCERPGRALCKVCGLGLAGPACPTAPTPAPPGLPPVWATAGYGGVVRAALIAHKERGRVTLAAPLGAALALAIETATTMTTTPPATPGTATSAATAGTAGATAATAVTAARSGQAVTPASGGAATPGPTATAATAGIASTASTPATGGAATPGTAATAGRPPGAGAATTGAERFGGSDELLIVPVPSARRAVRERGYDPMLAIARQAVRQLRRSGRKVRLVRPLKLSRRVADQTELGASERMANLAGAFTVPPRRRATIAGRTVVLVDDLMTTGATLHAVTSALREAGARVSAAAVVAATPRDSSR